MSAPDPRAPQYSLSWLLDVLERHGLIEPASRRDIEVQAPQQRARILKQKSGEASAAMESARYTVSPAELVASMSLTDLQGGALDDDRLARLMAHESGLTYYKIDPLHLDMGMITAIMSRPFALRHVVLPISMDKGSLVVAVEDPFDQELIENLRRISKRAVHAVVASKRDILKCITEIYGFRKSVESAARESAAPGDAFYDFEQLVQLRSVGEIESTDQHVVNAVDFLLSYAFDQRASDIHIEPRREASQVRLRIDGVLHDVHTIPRRVHAALVSRLKTMSRLDIAERRRPQDGRIKTVLHDKAVEIRVSTLPVAFGEKVVLRIFDPDVLLQSLPDLGFDEQELSIFERWIAAPHGLILITGPTGSGKTTTLYATLQALADETVNVTSIEDPIEMVTDEFNQVAVQPKIGVDFASALRTILRQDPDIIMVGEIRDGATAEMAVQAALTGHLVLSTLHTNDSLTAVTRLADLQVPAFLLGSTLVGIMAQRLLRRVCEKCRKVRPLSADQILALGIPEADTARFGRTCAGVGCVACRGTGYFGRLGIFEMLDFTPELNELILTHSPMEALAAQARRQGLRSLRECALDRLARGLTGFEEVVRVTGMGLAPPTVP